MFAYISAPPQRTNPNSCQSHLFPSGLGFITYTRCIAVIYLYYSYTMTYTIFTLSHVTYTIFPSGLGCRRSACSTRRWPCLIHLVFRTPGPGCYYVYIHVYPCMYIYIYI